MGVTVLCMFCKKEMNIKPSKLKRGWGKFCSRVCVTSYHKSQPRDHSKRIAKMCIVCKTVIYIKPSHALKQGTYCSLSCMAKDYETKLLGNKNPKWKGGVTTDKKEYRKSLRNENLEKYRKQTNGWLRAHPEKVREISRRRRANKKMVTGGHFTEDEWIRLCEEHGNKCLCCQRKDVKLTADHVIPLNPGQDTIDNIQPLCQSCNSSKGRKTIDYR